MLCGPWNVNDPLGWSRMYQVPFGPVGPNHPHECYAKHLHYECGMTLTQVAMEMNTTRENVHKLVNESCGVFTQNYIIYNQIGGCHFGTLAISGHVPKWKSVPTWQKYNVPKWKMFRHGK